MLRFGNEEWLVSPFGETAWVRNVRVDGRAELGRGRRFRSVQLTEVDGAGKVDVLVAYRRRFRVVPFVRGAFNVDSPKDREGIAREADRHPVFHVGEVTAQHTQGPGS